MKRKASNHEQVCACCQFLPQPACLVYVVVFVALLWHQKTTPVYQLSHRLIFLLADERLLAGFSEFSGQHPLLHESATAFGISWLLVVLECILCHNSVLSTVLEHTSAVLLAQSIYSLY